MCNELERVHKKCVYNKSKREPYFQKFCTINLIVSLTAMKTFILPIQLEAKLNVGKDTF